jgi:hypothetical protein
MDYNSTVLSSQCICSTGKNTDTLFSSFYAINLHKLNLKKNYLKQYGQAKQSIFCLISYSVLINVRRWVTKLPTVLYMQHSPALPSSINCSLTFVFIHVMKTNLMHYLSSVYFVNQPLFFFFTFVPYILILSKFITHQRIHKCLS